MPFSALVRRLRGRRSLAVVAPATLAALAVAFVVPVLSPADGSTSVKVTEVAPWGSDSSYGADWWELTNTGSTTADLTGWQMDDSSGNAGSASAAVSLNGVASLAPGESAIFLEGDTTKVAAFKTAWFGAGAPAGLQVGYYSGSGVGLSSGGDGVNVFDGSGTKLTGVTFGSSTAKVTFDNAAGAEGAISALSAVGTHGAFTSATGGETGGPGTIATAATAIDLSQYQRVHRYDLPLPGGANPTNLGQLAAEASSVTYDFDNHFGHHSLFVVGDEGTAVVEVSRSGEYISAMALDSAGSPGDSGGFNDTEGIAYLGNGQFAITEERRQQVDLFTYAPGTTLHSSDVKTVDLNTGPDSNNIGLEGLSGDPTSANRLLLLKEKDPQKIFQTTVDWNAGTATNTSNDLDYTGTTDLFDPADAGVTDFSDIYALANLPQTALTGPQRDNLLILSQESGKVVNIDRSGHVASTLVIRRDSGDAEVSALGIEGVTMDNDGNLYLANEAGGGVGHPQLWVYQRATAANTPPTGVTLTPATKSIPETANTTQRIKLADIDVVDPDGIGDNVLGLSGADAGSFEVDETGLYLKAGVSLDASTKPTYDVSVTATDVSTTVSAPFTLTITEPTGPVQGVRVTEVAPWSSGNSPVAADWWELTNTGSSTVDLTGWTFNDGSGVTPVALSGVSSLAPGESAVFIENANDIDEFIATWFGANVPAGLEIGSYAGPGLSTGGDQVNVYDAGGNKVAGVSFGASDSTSPYQTFDNSAALDGATISTLAAVGVNGAFTAFAGGEVGSPGTWVPAAAPLPSVRVTEVAPWSSGTALGADWWELTNTGTTTVSLADWRFDDDSHTFASALALNGVSSLAPGESAIFLEGDAAKVAAFKTAWFGSNVPAGLQVGYYSGSGAGLGTGGDEVNVYDGSGVKVTGVSFGASSTATPPASFDNAAGAEGAISTFSVAGTHGAFVSADGTGLGSPGTLVTSTPPAASPVRVTEVSPWSSGDSAYAADWFELTNTSASTVDLTGWKMDDSSGNGGSAANAIALNGVTGLAAGESAIFLETSSDATLATFKTTWFGGNVPAGLKVGRYSGSGVGLSTDGDAVNVFDASGTKVTGVTFGTATSGRTFDNAAGSEGAVTTLSTVGTHGAFTAAGASEVGSPGTIVNPPPPPVRVTEVSPWSSGDSTYAADWFELTNTGTATVDLTGWKMDDDSGLFANAVALNGVSSLAPGESAVFLESPDDTKLATFKTYWFGGSVPAGLKVGRYSGSGVGLGTGGDQVNVFDASGTKVTGVSFGSSTSGRTFDNAAGAEGAISALSALGSHGSFTAAGGTEIGSPGTIVNGPPPPVRVTEVSPWSSGDSAYAADWFELTNTGSTAVDLTGWKMDDDSGLFANAVALNGVSSLAAGESAIFLESSDDSKLATFKSTWFGASVPVGLKVGRYSGSGVGLGTGGDAVNIFDQYGNRVTGVTFGASTSGRTFDNAAGAQNTAISTLSTVGTHGAFTATNASEVGSPGTILPDTTAPVFTITGNAGSYLTSDTIHITCAVADELFGSGLDTTDCADITGSGSSFGIGSHTTTFHAKDVAGNTTSVEVTFTVSGDNDGDGIGDAADADDDNDGIADTVDVAPLTASTAFADGAGTSGTIVSKGGLSVTIADLAAPDGVKVQTGSGSGSATISACGFTLTVAASSSAELTCGSVKVHTLTGSVKIALGAGTSFVTVPAGATARVTSSGGGIFKVENLGTTPITQTSNDVPRSIAGGSTAPALDSVTVGTICSLTKSYVQGSAKYKSLNAISRLVVDVLSSAVCNALNAITPKLPAAQRKKVIDAYVKTLDPLRSGGWLTATQVADLTALVGQLPGETAPPPPPPPPPAPTVTAASICSELKADVHGSSKYGKLNSRQRSSLDDTVDRLCTADLDHLKGSSGIARSLLLAAFKSGVASLQSDGYLTKAQATDLNDKASRL